MKSSGGKIIIVAVALSALLITSSGAQASGLFGLSGNTAPARQIGLVQQALQWLAGSWTDLKVAFSQDEATPPPAPTCTNPNGCTDGDGDSGWTIDPEG